MAEPSISTHVLDVEAGLPAPGVAVTLERLDAHGPSPLFDGQTDADGRIRDLLGSVTLKVGAYRITLQPSTYFQASGRGDPFFTTVSVTFQVTDSSRHYHVPLLVARAACSTYRGT